nr:Cache 3/Cache 2 fusion domain-containing protein [uncultured Rhodoferax sp.]
MNKSPWYSRLGVGGKLSLSIVALVGVFVAVLVAGISFTVGQVIENRAIREVGDKTKLIVDLVEATETDLRNRAVGLSKIFAANLSGDFALSGETMNIGDKPTPVLTLAGKPVNMDFTLVDQFTGATGAVATIFAGSGEDFVRVTTSLKNDKGDRVVGTLLDRAHPGYKAVREGGGYTGVATLFGRQYMTHYEPIKNATGKVVGLAFVGLDFTDYIKSLKDGSV